ncbi:hypothetical protein BQ8482_130004 [Mesorhizobium delmotii]|uniref:Uncharacterized protein n=1 Tax=Mesorhizobium delmotii TaxID=1631247 RepID=A0A2P9AG42_9HYPH|nr:hypothetical protein BQ8482_130004 [Mesorhizobium delmotii]
MVVGDLIVFSTTYKGLAIQGALRSSEDVAAERSLGARTTRILAVHVLPSVFGRFSFS